MLKKERGQQELFRFRGKGEGIESATDGVQPVFGFISLAGTIGFDGGRGNLPWSPLTDFPENMFLDGVVSLQ